MIALKNACHWSATALKERVAGELTWPRIAELARDPADPAMQEEAVGLLRNLACTSETDIAMVMSSTGIGEAALFDILGAALWCTRAGTMLNVRLDRRATLTPPGALVPAQHRRRRSRILAPRDPLATAADARHLRSPRACAPVRPV